MPREIAVWGINKQGEKYFLLRESGKPDIRVPLAVGASMYDGIRDLIQAHGPANFTFMNDVGPRFGKKLRMALLDRLAPPSEIKQ